MGVVLWGSLLMLGQTLATFKRGYLPHCRAHVARVRPTLCRMLDGATGSPNAYNMLCATHCNIVALMLQTSGQPVAGCWLMLHGEQTCTACGEQQHVKMLRGVGRAIVRV